MSIRNEKHGWTKDGRSILSDESLAAVRRILDTKGSVIVEHRVYCGGGNPARLVFDDFEEFTDYLSTKARPDGSVYGKEKDMVGARGHIDPAPNALQLARDFEGVRIEPKDPAGVYTVEVVVKDNVKNVQLRLERKFTVEK